MRFMQEEQSYTSSTNLIASYKKSPPLICTRNQAQKFRFEHQTTDRAVSNSRATTGVSSPIAPKRPSSSFSEQEPKTKARRSNGGTLSSQTRQRAASSAAQKRIAAALSQTSQSVRIITAAFSSHSPDTDRFSYEGNSGQRRGERRESGIRFNKNLSATIKLTGHRMKKKKEKEKGKHI